MFERFTERARQVCVLAQDEALQYGSEKIATPHILLGLLREEEGIAAVILEKNNITLPAVRSYFERYGEPSEFDPNAERRQLEWSVQGKKALENALREALSMGHNYIGTEHILLGVLRTNALASHMLEDGFDLDYEKARSQITEFLLQPRKRVSELTKEQSDENDVVHYLRNLSKAAADLADYFERSRGND